MKDYRYVYVLRSLKDRMFYVGFTSDLRKRVEKITTRGWSPQPNDARP